MKIVNKPKIRVVCCNGYLAAMDIFSMVPVKKITINIESKKT